MFRTALVKMFEAKGLDCVFIETNMSMKKRYHMVYECIPLPKEVGDMAPIYFKVYEKAFSLGHLNIFIINYFWKSFFYIEVLVLKRYFFLMKKCFLLFKQM